METNQENTSFDMDNSNITANESNIEEIFELLDEPIETDTENNTENSSLPDEQPTSKDNTQTIECPKKFQNEDGTANLEKVLKSYKELEPLINEKSQWEKERAELLTYKEELEKQKLEQEESAKKQGFNSALDMEQEYSLISLEANEYAKYLHLTENPEETRKMLIDYVQNPTSELLDDIELEFPASIIKKVAIAKEQQRQQYDNIAAQKAQMLKMANIENVISASVDDNNELFDYAPFKNLFINTLHKYGDNFTVEDAQMLINTMVEMKELFREEFSKQFETKIENDKTTDKLTSISNINSAPAASQNTDISKMSSGQLANYLKNFV